MNFSMLVFLWTVALQRPVIAHNNGIFLLVFTYSLYIFTMWKAVCILMFQTEIPVNRARTIFLFFHFLL